VNEEQKRGNLKTAGAKAVAASINGLPKNMINAKNKLPPVYSGSRTVKISKLPAANTITKGKSHT
jgi:hypothetical protein